MLLVKAKPEGSVDIRTLTDIPENKNIDSWYTSNAMKHLDRVIKKRFLILSLA
jgi:hypothetical protein